MHAWIITNCGIGGWPHGKDLRIREERCKVYLRKLDPNRGGSLLKYGTTNHLDVDTCKLLFTENLEEAQLFMSIAEALVTRDTMCALLGWYGNEVEGVELTDYVVVRVV